MILPLLVFLLGAGGVFGAYLLINHLPGYMARRELDKRLRDVSMPGDVAGGIDSIIKKASQGPLPSLDRVVAKMKAGTWLAELIEQSGTHTTPSAVVVTGIDGSHPDLAGQVADRAEPVGQAVDLDRARGRHQVAVTSFTKRVFDGFARLHRG